MLRGRRSNTQRRGRGLRPVAITRVQKEVEEVLFAWSAGLHFVELLLDYLMGGPSWALKPKLRIAGTNTLLSPSTQFNFLGVQ